MRALVVLLVAALAVASATAIDENSPLGQRIIARSAQTPEDAEYVFAEVVEDIKNPDAEPLDMSAVELEAQIGTEMEQFPGYPAAAPGFYGQYNYAPQPQFNNNYLSQMRYAQTMGSGSSSASASSQSAAAPGGLGFGAAYAQFGVPYSAYPPIPPPMPTYLPPPPYIPISTPGSGVAAAQASA